MAGPKINLHVLWTLSLYSLNYSESCIRLCLDPWPHYSARPMHFESLGLSWLFRGRRVTCLPWLPCVSQIFICFLKPFTPEPPTSLLLLVTSSVLMVKDNFVCYLVQSEEIFQIIPEWTQLSQGQKKKKAKNLVTLTRKISRKSCFTSHLPFLLINSKILKAFQKTLPTKIKPTKCPVLKGKKMR